YKSIVTGPGSYLIEPAGVVSAHPMQKHHRSSLAMLFVIKRAFSFFDIRHSCLLELLPSGEGHCAAGSGGAAVARYIVDQVHRHAFDGSGQCRPATKLRIT